MMTSGEVKTETTTEVPPIPDHLLRKRQLESLHFQIKLNELKLSNAESAGAGKDSDIVVHLKQRLYRQRSKFETAKAGYLELWPDVAFPDFRGD